MWGAGRDRDLDALGAVTEAPQTAHWLSPPPTIAPQLRHMLGRPWLAALDLGSDKLFYVTSVMPSLLKSITLGWSQKLLVLLTALEFRKRLVIS
jgi:hypothetical protein